MSGLTKENVNQLVKGNNLNNDNTVPALLDVRIKESQKKLAEAQEALAAKEALAKKALEESLAKKALEDSQAKKAWEENNIKVTEKESNSTETKFLDNTNLPAEKTKVEATNLEGPELEGFDFTIKSYLSEGPKKIKSRKATKEICLFEK